MPATVRAAGIITWAFTALTGGAYLLLLVLVVADRAAVLDLLRNNPSVRDASLSDDALVGLLVGISLLIVVWCAAAAALAVLTWRRHTWAWASLLVSVGAAALLGIAALPFSLLHLAACGTVFGLLIGPRTRAWLRDGDASPPPPPAGWSPPSAPYAPPPPPPERPQDKPPVW